MSFVYEQNHVRPFVGGEVSTQDSLRIPQSNADPSRPDGLFFQKLMHEDETEPKVEVPCDIKILFEAVGDKLSDYDSSAGWEKSDGDLTPNNFSHKNTPIRSSSFKLAKNQGARNLAASNQKSAFSPRVNSTASPNFSKKFGASFTPMDNQRENKPILHPTFSNLTNSEESLLFQKVSLASLKMAFHCNFVCPFCTQIVQQIDNPDATYAHTVNGYQRIYLAHAECYLGSHNSLTFSEITNPLENIPAQISMDPVFASTIMSIETLPDIKKAYFLKLEGYHPISSNKLFKIERICSEICLTSDENQYLYINLEPKSSLFFESGAFNLPFGEFRVVATVYVTHSNDDAYTYEFSVDLSDLRGPSDNGKERSIEIFSKQGGSADVALGLEIILSPTRSDFLQKIGNKSNYYHPSLQNTLTTLKYLAIPLPLKRAPTKEELQQAQQARNQQQNNKDAQVGFMSPNSKQSRLKVFKGHNETELRSDNFEVRNQEQDAPLIPPNLHINLTQPKTHSRTPSGFMPNENRVNYPVKNLKASLTCENSPANKAVNSPASRKTRTGADTTQSIGFSEMINSFSAAVSASEQMVNQENGNNKQLDDLESDFRLEENLDKLPQLAKTYRGSKVLQDFIIKAGKTDIDKIILRMANAMMDLMLDPYANYMVQILAKHCSPEQRHLLLQKIAPGMYRIACDKKGTYALQTIVSLINTNAEDQLMKNALGPYVLELALDSQGNHVIQKLINTVSLKNIDFIYQPLIENFFHVATHSSGSLVFKQLIIKVEKLTNMKTAIIHTVCHEMENLVQDPYGNYVIQYALEYYPKDCSLIQQKIVSKLIPYSSQKFSSNIIEKSLAVGDYSFRKKVATEILKNDRLSDLLKNKYGNYVILHTLAICDNEDKQSIMEGIYRGVHSFQGTKYKLRWIKFLEENPLNIQWNVSASPSNRSPMGKNGGQVQSFEDSFNESELRIPKMPSKEEDLKKLEVVKKIWRDMNKEEKNPTPSNSTRINNMKNYSGFEDYADSNNGSPSHMMNEHPGNFYQEPFNFYLNATKTDEYKQPKWY